MKTILNFLPILFISLIFTSCAETIQDQLEGTWVLKEVTNKGDLTDEQVGIDEIFITLNADETVVARWYGIDVPTDFAEESGTWLFTEMAIDNGIGDLFLKFDTGQEVMVVKEVTDTKLVLMTGDYAKNEFIFEKK